MGAFDFALFLNYLISGYLLEGAALAILLAVVSMLIGTAGGLLIALARISKIKVLSAIAVAYIWLFRGTPLLLQLLFFFAFLPQLGWKISSLGTAILAFSLNVAAYQSEIIRAGLEAVDRSQILAAKSLGMPYLRMMRRIVIPQAIKIIIPPTGNFFFNLLLSTSLASVIALSELLLRAQQIASVTFRIPEVYAAAAVYYLVITSIFMMTQSYIEARLGERKAQFRGQENLFKRITRALLNTAPPGPLGSSLDFTVKPAPVQTASRPKRSTSEASAPVIESSIISVAGESDRRDDFVRIEDVEKSYHGHRRSRVKAVPVLNDVSFQVATGEVVAILGPSGAGKSTLLRCINRLEDFDHGTILIDGVSNGYRMDRGRRHSAPERELAKMRSSIGMVFQDFALFPHITAMENVTEGPVALRKKTLQEAKDRALELLAAVGMLEHAHKYPHELSGGQQQRVAIARALAMDPKLMLFDEPTSALDVEMVGEVLAVMRSLAEDGMTMIVVTHEVGFAKNVADTVVFMADGGVVEHTSSRAFFENPQSERGRKFLSSFVNND